MGFKLTFDQMMDTLLAYNRDHCRAMHTQADQDKYRESFFKAEAARDIIINLSMKLDEKDRKIFRQRMSEKLAAMQESIFFGEVTGSD